MADRNILILRVTASRDNDVKTGYADVDVENGFAVGLGELSTDRKHRGAYKVAAPAKGDIVGLVYNADAPFLTDERGNVFRYDVHDPRMIHFPAGTNFDIYMPSKNDEIAMTNIEGTKEGATHVVIKAGSMKPEYATSDADAIVAFKITGEKFVSVGTDRVPTTEMICIGVKGATSDAWISA